MFLQNNAVECNEHDRHYYSNAESFLNEVVLTQSEVYACLLELDPGKASGPDNIPAKILKLTAEQISPSICRLFNLSLRLGMMPTAWKEANVTPVFKNGNEACVENYRPISLLCILSKVLERCVYNRIYDLLSSKIAEMQHSFQRRKTCSTQLIQFYHNILEALDKLNVIDSMYLDFTKAFDKVSHCLLLQKLEKSGFGGNLMSWFRSYLSGGKQRVVLEGQQSDWLNVSSGVPQGSILGPLLFTLYINDLPDQIVSPTQMGLYADDSKMFRVIKSEADVEHFRSDLANVQEWSRRWQMNFNTKKCKFMRFSHKKSITDIHYDMNGVLLERVKVVRDLGITVTDDLCWVQHISEISLKANRTLDIKDVEIRKVLYCSLIRPQLEYATELWSPKQVAYKRILENVQRRATKFILDYPPHCSYKDRLIKLNLLPLEHRRAWKNLVFFFKCQIGLYDLDISSIAKQRVVRYNIRSFNNNNFNEIKCNTEFYKHSYFPRVIRAWNLLPDDLKTVSEIGVFKGKLRKHFYETLNDYIPP